MNNLETRYALPLVLCAAAALSACGGGSGGDDEADVFVDRTQTAMLLQSCDRELPTLGNADNAVDYSTMPATTVMHDIASLAAAGHGFDAQANYELRATLDDFRPRQQVPGYAFIPFKPANASISVQVQGALGDQAVACVRKLSYPRFSDPVVLGNGRVSLATWEDAAGFDLVLPATGTVLDGFELSSNFEPRNGSITYRLPKSMAADGSALSECYQPSQPSVSGSWSCRTAQLSDGGNHWVLTLPGVRPGRHLLVSSHAQFGS